MCIHNPVLFWNAIQALHAQSPDPQASLWWQGRSGAERGRQPVPGEGIWGQTRPRAARHSWAGARRDVGLWVWVRIRGAHGQAQAEPHLPHRAVVAVGQALQSPLKPKVYRPPCSAEERSHLYTGKIENILREGTVLNSTSNKKTPPQFRWSQRRHRRGKCETFVWSYAEGWEPAQSLWCVAAGEEDRIKCFGM